MTNASELPTTTDRDELVLAHELRAVAMALGELDDFTVRAPDLVMERDLAACICREAADRIQANAATIARMQWQPIETAPDGVMCLFADMKADEARNWAFVDWVVRGRFCGNIRRTATHWMPLPNPPALKGGDHG